MKQLFLSLSAAAALAACTPAAPFPPPVTPPPAAGDSARPATPQPAPRPRWTESTLPQDWHLTEWGIDLRRAERELLAGRQPQREVVVAVIDGGVDTAHVDLRANLWRNADEVAGNGRDDDDNGYVDDVYGWNFIGGPDLRSVNEDTYEITRLYSRCRGGSSNPNIGTLPERLRARCNEIEREFQRRRLEAEQTLLQIRSIEQMYDRQLPLLRQALGTDSLTRERVAALRPTRSDVRQAQQMYLQLAEQGITPEILAEAKEQYETQVEYNFNPDFNPRPIVGDPADPNARRYGNRDVMGPDADHGTHVSGIIGAVRGNGEGTDGIAPRVKIMAIRAVPNGDERDKDVANAIRYAADNGAHIINMSFGKAWSPQKELVDEAVRYAVGKGVLLVHAAGNESQDVTTAPNFPTPVYLDSAGRAPLWIEVGASSWKGADSLVATFSNYSQREVDVFAPGVDIYSTVPGSKYERESGTSMAAPVVSGLAALIMSYYPQLTAAQVKQVILESAVKQADADVYVPGGDKRVKFGTLSATGAIVSAYEALRRAEQMAAARP